MGEVAVGGIDLGDFEVVSITEMSELNGYLHSVREIGNRELNRLIVLKHKETEELFLLYIGEKRAGITRFK